MKVLSQLIRAQLENKASDYSAATAKGLAWLNTSSGKVKYDDGTNVKVVSVTTDVIPETTGGTNQTTYTQGDILYASAANTLSKLAKGVNGQFLQQGATIPSWASVAATLGVKTKAFADSPYTILAGDDLILVDTSGGAVTLTLPASSGGGKVYRFKKTTSDLTAVTIARAGADTIQDVSTGGTSTTINTQGEEIMIIDATSGVWQVIDRRIPSVWNTALTFTPDSGAFGTISNSAFFSRRNGDSIEVRGYWTNGTVAGAAAAITLPSGIALATTKLPGNTKGVIGIFTQLDSSGTPAVYATRYMHTDSTVTDKVYLGTNGVSTVFNNDAATSVFNTGFGVAAEFKIPVLGWNG